MTLVVISPDYASHLFPLATLATAWQDAGERVVVATGPATDTIVRGFGYEREHLQLGRGSNPGVIRAEEQPRGRTTPSGTSSTRPGEARSRRSPSRRRRAATTCSGSRWRLRGPWSASSPACALTR